MAQFFSRIIISHPALPQKQKSSAHTFLPQEPNALSGAMWVFGKTYQAVIIIRRGGHRNIEELFHLLGSENDTYMDCNHVQK